MVGKKNRDNDDWRRDFFGDFFGDFDFDFRRLNDRMMKVFGRLRDSIEETGDEPFVYGFTYRVGSDGKPIFQEFGNVPGLVRTPNLVDNSSKGANIREPITDLNEDDEKYYMTFELPGVTKSDIHLEVNESNIIVRTNDESRQYYKELEFPSPINTDSAKAKFVNGILDVSVTKQKKGKPSGKNIDIE
ncbi:MAG: Hsp20/alpha crystallin family protein [Candidatus Thermoplasmatota archaeon]|jgi:HSP20 family protein|nr:Hsp20/alpha crystallin family protein [Candidatus Thermoplasmatota archaeon]MCL5800595.1 Hsp20/alpha crystallin family protein [Candidatus Thermoplasmatota archaeon]